MFCTYFGEERRGGRRIDLSGYFEVFLGGEEGKGGLTLASSLKCFEALLKRCVLLRDRHPGTARVTIPHQLLSVGVWGSILELNVHCSFHLQRTSKK